MSHSLFLRGGEVEHIRNSDVQFVQRSGEDCLLIHVYPLKKKKKTPRFPFFIPAAPLEEAGTCPVAASRKLLSVDPANCLPYDPFFRRKFRGAVLPLKTADIRDFARSVTRASNLPSSEVGAHSWRIGGCTDHANGGGQPLQVSRLR